MPTDTSPEVAAIYDEMLMARSPEERVRMAASQFECSKKIILSTLQHIEDPNEKKRALYSRIYGTNPPPDWFPVLKKD